jgi:two-component system, chemotaxis family, protein-glutamate methylesterase/glutaminase
MTVQTPFAPLSDEKPVRILLVDDSAFMRLTLTNHLNQVPGLVVVGAARDGNEALVMIPELKPDVVTLDVEMPQRDGLSTLREIMDRFPLPVIMLSSLTTEGARETIQALTLGAVDFIPKPTTKANIVVILDDVVEKIRRAAAAKVRRILLSAEPTPMPVAEPSAVQRTTHAFSRHDKVVVIGSSTGGPLALCTVVKMLPADLPAALVIIQHMPVGFTRSLAERLDHLCPLRIKEAAPDDRLEVGQGLLAPGGFHMRFDENGIVSLDQSPTLHGVRPAVDVTMSTIAQHFGDVTVAAILTGMGRDGAHGCELVHAAGGKVIAEAESTCVVWGMPRSVAETGVTDIIAPLPEVAAAITRLVTAI